MSTPPTLTKIAANTTCRIDQTYDVSVSNTSTIDSLRVDSLSDNIYGDITQVQGAIQSTTCGQVGADKPGALPYTILPGSLYACSFVARSTDCNGTIVDTVTAVTEESDGVDFSPSDSATLTVTVSKP